jgi:hypothetical protein
MNRGPLREWVEQTDVDGFDLGYPWAVKPGRSYGELLGCLRKPEPAAASRSSLSQVVEA